MPLFLGKSLRSWGVNCSASCCQFASSLDSRSINGLLLSSRSRKLFKMSSFAGLRLNFLLEEFFMGLIFLLEEIYIFAYFSYLFISHLPATPVLCMCILMAVITEAGSFCLPCWSGLKVREVTATALMWYSFNSDRRFFIPSPSIASNFFRFVLYKTEKSEILPVFNLLELVGCINHSKWRLDAPSDTLEFAVGDVLVWPLLACNQYISVFFAELVRRVQYSGQPLRFQPYRRASLCPLFCLFGEGSFESFFHQLVYNFQLSFCVWIFFFHLKILLWTEFEPHSKSLHLV